MRRFFRLSGSGNDFLGFESSSPNPDPDEIRTLCRRGLSAGADGLFLLEKRPDSIGMQYFNADGNSAELCLNGTRCAVRLANHLGWVTDVVAVETGAGVVLGRLEADGRIALELPRPEAPRPVALDHAGSSYGGWHLSVGVPHFVLVWSDSLQAAPVGELGPPLRSHSEWGEQGANVDFVRFPDRHHLEIRTFERGVEAETLACGTGVMAAVAAGIETGSVELPVTALTLGGFELEVDRAGDTDAWTLAGDARLIAEGTLHPGALEIPEPPAWT